ncbi:MAG: HlyC/CorC family transporter [Acidobacteria bacterium]|nr:HlyC/CorC family transporter [Acidobacteriota bacterium]MCB9378961.1 HlyC/CorC family transporter [Holophagales bacterium]
MSDEGTRIAIWAAVIILPLVPILSVLTALLERSGPIRMRHWVEEAGGRLRALYEVPARFEVFRYLLNICAKLAPLALFLALSAAAEREGLQAPRALALIFVAIAVAATELASRSLLGRDPESALRRTTSLYRFAAIVLSPLVVLFAPIARRRALEADEPEGADLDEEATEEEVEAFIDIGTHEGILEPSDRDLVWGVVDFRDTQVRSVMTPRVDIVAASAESTLDELAELFATSAHSRIPLYRGSIDQVIGVLHIRDLLSALRAPVPKPAVAGLAQPPLLVPETKMLGDLLEELRERRQQMAVVINEWGGTEGLVTVEDLIEEIVGEIADEHDVGEPERRLLEDGSVLFDGRAELDSLDEFFGYRPTETQIETVGGFVTMLFGRVPENGEAIDHEGLRYETESADNRRILSVRVRRVAEAEG